MLTLPPLGQAAQPVLRIALQPVQRLRPAAQMGVEEGDAAALDGDGGLLAALHAWPALSPHASTATALATAPAALLPAAAMAFFGEVGLVLPGRAGQLG